MFHPGSSVLETEWSNCAGDSAPHRITRPRQVDGVLLLQVPVWGRDTLNCNFFVTCVLRQAEIQTVLVSP